MFESDGTQIEVTFYEGLLSVNYSLSSGFKQILENGGEESMREKHGDLFSVEDRNISLKIPVPSVINLPKDATPEQKEEIHAKNKVTRETLQKLSEDIPNKWSCIKRDFVGGPIY